jgi:hypothetical protein
MSFAAGFAVGDDEGYHRGYRIGEQLGTEIGRTNGQIKVHEMWTTATSFGTEKPNLTAVKLIDGFVYGK